MVLQFSVENVGEYQDEKRSSVGNLFTSHQINLLKTDTSVYLKILVLKLESGDDSIFLLIIFSTSFCFDCSS
jgi:hypothetical protein